MCLAENGATQFALCNLAQQITDYLLPLAGASALAVALLEAFKKLFSIQGRFHRRAVLRWLCEVQPTAKGVSKVLGLIHGTNHYMATAQGVRATQFMLNAFGPDAPQYDHDRAYSELKQLTTGLPIEVAKPAVAQGMARFRSVERALFELETPRMMAQIQDAADAVLNNPDMYLNLFVFLTRGCRPADVAAWQRYVTLRDRAMDGGAGAAGETAPVAVVPDVYSRIRLMVRRQLDGFQSVTLNRWADLNQLWAMVVGAIVLLVAQWLQETSTGAQGSAPVLQLVLTSAFGGMLAPVAKDLIASISQIASKS